MEKINICVQGKCMEMCPLHEIQMREKEKLLHILEMVPGTEKSKYPKASRKHMVKAFSRSAAGKQMKVESLRPPDVLLTTVKYLLSEVIMTKTVQWHVVYDFITDRLMAVRQDMVVQNISKAECITLLQPIVRFHAYAAYKLCGTDIANFDPTLNNNHLQECLKKLLHCYDAYDHYTEHNDYIKENRPEFEALYLIFNLGNEEAMRRALTIPKSCKTGVVKTAMEISLCYKFGNFVRLCRLLQNLPALLARMAALHLPVIRRKAFQVMSIAYHSKNLSFPLKTLKEILLYGTENELLQDCKYYEIKVDGESLYFTKSGFNASKSTVSPKHVSFIEEKWEEDNVHCVILGM